MAWAQRLSDNPVRLSGDPLSWRWPCSQSKYAPPCYARPPCPLQGSRPCVISFRRAKVDRVIAAAMMTVSKVWRRQVRFLASLVMILAHIPPADASLLLSNILRLCRYPFLCCFLWLAGAVHSFLSLPSPLSVLILCSSPNPSSDTR